MARTHASPHPQAEFRHRSPSPMPAVEDVEQRLTALPSSSVLALRQLERRDPRQPQRLLRMRHRSLTLPVIVAIVVSLVWRRMPAVAEVPKVVAREGVLWSAPIRVSAPALTKRLDVLPAAVMGQLFTEVCARLQEQAPAAVPHPSGAPVREPCPRLALVDGSTREARRNKTQVLPQRQGLVLGGKLMVMVDACSHRPLWQLWTEDAAANDQRFATEIMAARPGGGLLVCDLGFFSLLWCDGFTTAHRFCGTHLREKTASRTVRELVVYQTC